MPPRFRMRQLPRTAIIIESCYEGIRLLHRLIYFFLFIKWSHSTQVRSQRRPPLQNRPLDITVSIRRLHRKVVAVRRSLCVLPDILGWRPPITEERQNTANRKLL